MSSCSAKHFSALLPCIKADAKHLPFGKASFDGATCVLAIHHFVGLLEPFMEVYRVLDNGRFVIFTSSPEQMRRYWLNAYFPKAMEASIKQMPSMDDVIFNLREVGFSVVGVESFLLQWKVRATDVPGFNRAEWYFDVCESCCIRRD